MCKHDVKLLITSFDLQMLDSKTHVYWYGTNTRTKRFARKLGRPGAVISHAKELLTTGNDFRKAKATFNSHLLALICAPDGASSVATIHPT